VSVAFLMDEHFPGPIIRALRRRHVDVLTAQEDGSDGFSDPALLARASALRRALVTADADFLIIAADHQRRGVPFTGIFYADLGAATYGRFIDDLEAIAEASDLDEWRNVVKHLPL
jgi:hypothetical protein